jgi:uncharacterized protein YhaN
MTPEELEKFGERLPENGRDRDRISELAKHFARIARDLDERERRVEKAIRVLQAAAALLIVFGFVGWLALREQARETDRVAARQTVARYQAVYSSCLERNKTNTGIVTFLEDLGTKGRVLAKARMFFPNEPDCRTYTEALLGQNVPDGAYDIPETVRRRTERP